MEDGTYLITVTGVETQRERYHTVGENGKKRIMVTGKGWELEKNGILKESLPRSSSIQRRIATRENGRIVTKKGIVTK